MPDIIYCKNYNCKHNKKLDEGIVFKFSSIAVPFEGDKCYGKCSVQAGFCGYDFLWGDFRQEGAECVLTPTTSNKQWCTRKDCVHNSGGPCSREEILVDKLGEHLWVCKCFSFRKVRGHMDWSALLQGGNAKGGQIDDDYAHKINKWSKTTRSYRTHMKQIS